jgi:HPt (histidine-containing phosphotransfer) domain-containing protein
LSESADVVIDISRLESFTGADPALEAELAALFVETAELYLARLRDAVDDVGAWQRSAHALKGASANIGALVVARLAAEQEQREPDIAALRRLDTEVAAVRYAFEARGSLPRL